MKQLLLLLGPNGVGKTTTAAKLLDMLPHSAYLDADWCHAINPFPFTAETKKTVTENVFCLLRNYLLCPEIHTVIFPYGFHGQRKRLFETVLRRLEQEPLRFQLTPVLLSCSLKETIRRAKADGRGPARIERGIQNTFHFYDQSPYPKIDTTNRSPEQTAREILSLLDPQSIVIPPLDLPIKN